MSGQSLTQEQITVGLKAALRIMNAWQASPGDTCKILRISPSTFRRASANPDVVRNLDQDQQQRISLVLGIHASLRAVFTNQANVTGFPRMQNGNPFFEGRSPLEVMAQGDMISLYETYKRIDQLRHLGHE